MSGWRHVTECGCERRHCLVDGYEPSEPGCVGPCLCERPTPDPSERWNEDGMCENCQTPWKCNGPHDYTPTHPTRCTCGHPIEEAE